MDPQACRDLEAVYKDLQQELDARNPVCRLSGRCCRLKDFGHQLWTTRLELNYLVDRRGLPARPADGVCPYLEAGKCGVRDHRMLGCRVFFCDETFRSEMSPLYEKYHRRIRELHSKHGLEYECFEYLGEIDRLRQEADVILE